MWREMGLAVWELWVGWGLELMVLRELAKDFGMSEQVGQVLMGRRKIEGRVRVEEPAEVLLSFDEPD
jgi:hypothetical protein